MGSAQWDQVVFTLDWLSADQLTGRTPFCMEGTPGVELLDSLVVDKDSDVIFKKNADDSFCIVGGCPEERTGCSQLGEVLKSLGFEGGDTVLVFVGQRFERCILKTVVHARDLGYESIIVDEGTYTKTQEADPEWSLKPVEVLSASAPENVSPAAGAKPPSWASEVYLCKKSAGRVLSEGYMKAAGVRIMSSWPEPFPGFHALE